MKQGEIYWVKLNPTVGREQGGKRPCVIISGNSMNKKIELLIVCPISSQLKFYPGSFFVEKNNNNNLKNDSEILTFQIKTISKSRVGKKIGKITDEQLNQVFQKFIDILKY